MVIIESVCPKDVKVGCDLAGSICGAQLLKVTGS